MIALTKTMDPADFDLLQPACRFVDLYLSDACEVRRWEYTMALFAARHWWWQTQSDVRVADVGGAGSPFSDILKRYEGSLPIIIDPHAGTGTIEAYTGDPFDVIFALSVLEHVPDVDAFLAACVRHLLPGGLLFLTVDIWDQEPGSLRSPDGSDTAHFHWMRERIFTLRTWWRLDHDLHKLGMQRFSEADWDYHGDQIYGSYSFASLAMVKESA